jgi:hypothetical protein
MGAWGAGSFDNDDAMDWASGLAEGSADIALRQALAPFASTEDSYLEAPTCSVAIAAAEAVAAARGHPSTSMPEEVTGWVKTKPVVGTDLVTLARAALDRIVRKSELKELWDASDSAEDWRTAISDLRARLD